MPTLKKFSNFQSLKAAPPCEKTITPQLAEKRNDARMEFIKTLQHLKAKALASHSGNGKKLLK